MTNKISKQISGDTCVLECIELKNNNSCDGCKYDEKNDSYPSICWECSRYYADKFELKELNK